MRRAQVEAPVDAEVRPKVSGSAGCKLPHETEIFSAASRAEPPPADWVIARLVALVSLNQYWCCRSSATSAAELFYFVDFRFLSTFSI